MGPSGSDSPKHFTTPLPREPAAAPAPPAALPTRSRGFLRDPAVEVPRTRRGHSAVRMPPPPGAGLTAPPGPRAGSARLPSPSHPLPSHPMPDGAAGSCPKKAGATGRTRRQSEVEAGPRGGPRPSRALTVLAGRGVGLEGEVRGGPAGHGRQRGQAAPEPGGERRSQRPPRRHRGSRRCAACRF